MVESAKCGTEVAKSTKEWDYFIYHVKNFECKKCERSFRAYYRGGKLSHTIPKAKPHNATT